MQQCKACLLVNIAHPRKFHELGHSVFEIGKVSKMEQRRETGCDRLLGERCGGNLRRLARDGTGPVQCWGRFFDAHVSLTPKSAITEMTEP
jgi:hypothetical protein